MNGGPKWMWDPNMPYGPFLDKAIKQAVDPDTNTVRVTPEFLYDIAKRLNEVSMEHLMIGPPIGKRTATEILAQMGNYPPQGNGAWGFPNLTGVPPSTPKTDQEIDDSVREVVDGLDRERQIIAYKYLHGAGLRIGSTLDYELSELRRERKKGDVK